MSFIPFEPFGCWDVMLLHAGGADPVGFIASRTGLFLKDSCKLLYIYKYKISHLGWGLVIGELKAFSALAHVTLLHALNQLENFGLQRLPHFPQTHLPPLCWLTCHLFA